MERLDELSKVKKPIEEKYDIAPGRLDSQINLAKTGIK